MGNIRRNLAVQLIPVGGANPLKLRIAVPAFVLGTAGMTGALIGQGGTPAYAYSIATGALPTGLSLNSTTGVISGTPSAAGTFTFSAQIQDAALTTYIATFTMNVAHIVQPTAASPIDADWATGIRTYQFAVSGSTGTVAYSITSPPSGVSISSSGLLSFNTSTPPNAFQAYAFNVNVSDAGTGDAIVIPVAFNLYPFLSANWSSFLSPVNIPIGATSTFSFISSLSPTGGKPPYTWRILDDGSGGSVPSWISVSFNSGVLTIVPPATSVTPNTTQGVRIQITDSLGLAISATLTCVFVSPNNVIQLQQAGVNAGSPGFATKNYTGGAFSVTNVAGVAIVNLPQATGSVSGYLLAADWTTFNNGIVTAGAQTWTGDKTFTNKIIPSSSIQWLTSAGFPATLTVNGTAFDYVSAINGRVIYGCGSTWDVLIANRGGSVVMGVTPNTQNAQFGGNVALNNGDIDITLAGKGLKVAEGSNAKQGTTTLVAGTVTVSNTAITANSRIFLTAQNTGGTPGALRISARTAGTSFVITSTSASDTSLVAYEIFEPG